MTLEEQLGPFAGKSVRDVDPSEVQADQQAQYEHWVAKEFGHFLLFDHSYSKSGWMEMERHLRRLSQFKGMAQDRVVDHVRTLYCRAVNQRRDEFIRERGPEPLDAFMVRHVQCSDLAMKILFRLDDRLGLTPEDVNWGHVTDLVYATNGLRYVARLLGVRGTNG